MWGFRHFSIKSINYEEKSRKVKDFYFKVALYMAKHRQTVSTENWALKSYI